MTDVQLLLRGRRLGPDGDGRALREQAGLSVRDMAAILKVNPVTYWRWEIGRERPGRERAIRWAEVAGDLEAELARQASLNEGGSA